MAPVRVGIIGTGFGARVVAPSFEAAGCTIGGIASPRDDAAWRALCASGDVDLVAVHSPPFLHRAHVFASVRGPSGSASIHGQPAGAEQPWCATQFQVGLVMSTRPKPLVQSADAQSVGG